MTGLRVIDTGSGAPRWNIAVTAALAGLHAEARIPDTLRFHRYPPCVLLGRSQPADAVDRAACARVGAGIARRITGGGAVAMGPGVLAWDLVTGPRWRSPDVAAAALGAALAAALGVLGIAAEFRPPGDVAVGGRKIAGLSGAFESAILVQQGSLLVAPDVAAMAALLGQPALPVTTLAEAVAPVPTHEALIEAIAAAFAAALDLPPEAAALDTATRVRAAALLAAEVGTDAFVLGEAEAVR